MHLSKNIKTHFKCFYAETRITLLTRLPFGALTDSSIFKEYMHIESVINYKPFIYVSIQM